MTWWMWLLILLSGIGFVVMGLWTFGVVIGIMKAQRLKAKMLRGEKLSDSEFKLAQKYIMS